MVAKATLTNSMSISLTGTSTFGNLPRWAANMSESTPLTDGVLADQFDLAYVDERTVADGATDSIDVNGVLTDALGNIINAVTVVAIILINKQMDGTANTTNLTLGGGANALSAYTSAVGSPIAPGGVYIRSEPGTAGVSPVTPATGDILTVVNSAGAANTYQIAILARSA